MTRRPADWSEMTDEQRMKWLRKQKKVFKGGRKGSLKEQDKLRIWSLMHEHKNKSLVADLLGVNRRTLIRFMKKNPVPKTFKLKDTMILMDFPEIQIWRKRLEGFAGKTTINSYVGVVRKFFRWMKENHPERAKPSLWTSDDINEFIFGNKDFGGDWAGIPSHMWHAHIVPLRSLNKKAPNQFPSIDLGLLPTKRTHAAKRSLAGVPEYYLDFKQVCKMIEEAEKKRDKAMLAFLFNMICRTKALTDILVSDIDLKNHHAKIKDKGGITWMCYGLSDETCKFLAEYLEERGHPTQGYLFTNGNDNKLTSTQVNQIIKKAGKKAGVEGKILTGKVFRKSFVKHALTPQEDGGLGMAPVSLIGTGKRVKTCFCVGWTEMKVLMEHYAPRLMSQIQIDRAKFHF